MLRRLLLAGGILALSACGSADVTQIKTDAEKFIRASSGSLQDIPGTVRDTVELGKQGIEDAKKTINQIQEKTEVIQKGIGQVQDGIESIKNGKKMLEGTVYGVDSSSVSSR